MPWYNGDYPPSYKNLPIKVREKAVEIANAILKESGDESLAIAMGLNGRNNGHRDSVKGILTDDGDDESV